MDDSTPDKYDRIESLALNFPCMQRAPGAVPWDALKLDAWAASPTPSHGERCTAQFLLAVWNPYGEWASGEFDVMDALGIWDDIHRWAFIKWASAPWWA